MASEPLAVPLLLGLGVDELSASVPLIPAIKAAIRDVELRDCEAIARHALTLESAGQVRETLLSRRPSPSTLSLVSES